ncbi:DsbA family protein [Nannocystis radixulma]|uniref:Thioredoxin domain-containing protein n=1 Tax=Nannocystis radixulma TaxID=2995305 RepID=A0ABT5BBS2_9BACT|nr:thioredoxin domain-containing protein [Nannocystis radixulma]MDC0670979.1 thioredoxin domain-containing protein [Nannocystis radixulma]
MRVPHLWLGQVAFGLALSNAACECSPAASETEAQPAAAPIAASSLRHRVDLGPDEHALGGAEPLVTIVVFSDYACPPCARVWKVLEHLVEDYGDDLRVVFRSQTLPGFGDGERAAEAALAAGAQGQFWPMHRRLYDTMQFNRAALKADAEALGLDVPRFLDDFDAGVFSGTRIRHRREAVSLGIYFSPVALVNGRALVGFRDEAAWHALIDEEILAAQARLRQGTARADLYAAIMADAVVAPIEVDEATAKQRRALAERFKAAEQPPPQRAEPGKRYAVDAGDAPTVGPADAPVLLVAFMDFECPFCRKAATEGIAELRRRYPNDLRIAYRQLPLPIHASADSAARAVVAADRQDQFWAYAERLFAAPRLGRRTYAEIARELGLDEARFLADLDSAEVAHVVRDDLVYARRLGLDATPAFFVNGRYIDGFRGTEALAAEVAAELAHAQERITAGAPRDAVVRAILDTEAIPPTEFPSADLQQ